MRGLEALTLSLSLSLSVRNALCRLPAPSPLYLWGMHDDELFSLWLRGLKTLAVGLFPPILPVLHRDYSTPDHNPY